MKSELDYRRVAPREPADNTFADLMALHNRVTATQTVSDVTKYLMPNRPLINSLQRSSRRKEAHDSSEKTDKQSLLTSAATF